MSMPRTNRTSAPDRCGDADGPHRVEDAVHADAPHAGVMTEGAVLGAMRRARPAPESAASCTTLLPCPSGPNPCAGVVGPNTATTGVPTPVAKCSGAESLVTSSAARAMIAADSRNDSAPAAEWARPGAAAATSAASGASPSLPKTTTGRSSRATSSA